MARRLIEWVAVLGELIPHFHTRADGDTRANTIRPNCGACDPEGASDGDDGYSQQHRTRAIDTTCEVVVRTENV
jgi:hypothetical protein